MKKIDEKEIEKKISHLRESSLVKKCISFVKKYGECSGPIFDKTKKIYEINQDKFYIAYSVKEEDDKETGIGLKISCSSIMLSPVLELSYGVSNEVYKRFSKIEDLDVIEYHPGVWEEKINKVLNKPQEEIISENLEKRFSEYKEK